ncbi:MAG TPA: Holliday junction branch migration protein RuvA, partial [Spirochaetales bacterium]|nr:Holliday junction branch migration protein RuvA [Spirochaetales bacterium]
DLERALDSEDLARLESIPGLGKKTAQKLVFSLKGKLPSSQPPRPGADADGPYEDIVRALVDLGYERRKAQDAVRTAAADPAIAAVEPAEREREIFRRAMMALSGA